MSEKGFVYSGTMKANELAGLLEHLSEPVHLVWDLASIVSAQGMPENLRDGGTAFDRRCEIRWQRIGTEAFRVLLLSDEPVPNLSLKAIGNGWQVEEQVAQLVPLDAPQFSPPFASYPVANAPKGKLRCRVFYREGAAMFFSPREVIPNGA